MKRSYDNQSDIPAGLESYYTEQGGMFVRDDSKIDAVPAASGDVARLTKALDKERADHKATKTSLTAKEAERVQAQELLEALQLTVDAAGGKADEGKITELVTARVTAKTAPLNKKIDELTGQIKERDDQIVAFQGERTRNTITSAVTSAARVSKIVDAGLDEVNDLAARVMEIGEDSKVITKANHGFTPGLDPAGFLGELKTKRAYLWPLSVGGGASGSNGGGAQGDWGKMSITERGQFVKTNGMEKSNQLAKAAGFESALALKPNPKN